MRIIIIGASRGIGKCLYEMFKEHHHDVIGTYCTNNNGNTDLLHLDSTDIKEVNKFAEVNRVDHIVLINCAGISYNAFAHKSNLEKWRKVVEVNLIGTFNVIHSFLPYMRENKWGRIINFSSVVTKMPTPGVSAYAASKSALIGLTKTLSVENAMFGITVNSINLGYTNAGMGINDVPERYREIITNQIPEKRFCEPIEIFNTVEYIIKTEYLSGSIIDLNGGLI